MFNAIEAGQKTLSEASGHGICLHVAGSPNVSGAVRSNGHSHASLLEKDRIVENVRLRYLLNGTLAGAGVVAAAIFVIMLSVSVIRGITGDSRDCKTGTSLDCIPADDSWNETSTHIRGPGEPVIHVTGMTGYSMGRWESNRGLLIVRLSGNTLIHEWWREAEVFKAKQPAPAAEEVKVAAKWLRENKQ